ncbi:MAG: hypothetical protein WA687_11590 [Solirubrobacterales bacterium]
MKESAEAQLRQYEALWAEIARRSNAQQALIAATVTATGTVSGLVVAGKADAVLLVVLAVVSPVFGLLWLDHARNIDNIGGFIRSNWAWSPNWELEHESRKGTKREATFRFIIFTTAVTIVFLGPAAGGLIASFSHPGSALIFITAWCPAAMLTALFAVAWLVHVGQTRPSRASRSLTA